MTRVSLPDPVVRRARPPQVDARELERALRERVGGEVRFDAGSRGAYSTDASNYRQVPIGVVVPHGVEDAVAAVAVCREHGAPVVSRGGGTSLAGQARNVAVVIDWSKYCHSLVSVDAGGQDLRGRAWHRAGRAQRPAGAAPADVRPEAGHPRSLHAGWHDRQQLVRRDRAGHGKTVDNVVRLEVLSADGSGSGAGPTSDEEYAATVAAGGRRAGIYRRLRELSQAYAGQIRQRYPDIPRRVSGYNLDSLLPEQGFDVAGALVGSESTLVTVLHAELGWCPCVGPGAGGARLPGHRHRGRRRAAHRCRMGPSPSRASTTA